ncbi:hypothetical protein [Geminocystis herdmanii]|uniref:hypothetical protein n=1 Tax=Geminocystis herdmanii TaxID=669359 RepID=UPI000349A248|nr:hypothetical protein [Geminocystis herdmanii]
MTTQPAYSLFQENQDIIVRVNKEIFSEKQLTKFLEYLILENISSSSKLTSEKAEELASEIDQKIWKSIESRILEK